MIDYKKLLIFSIIFFVVIELSLQNTMAVHDNCRSHNSNDIDGDNISNNLEINGIDINRDGNIDLDLKELGASPLHKDLFLELDYMKYHKPYSDVVGAVNSSFNNVPVCNPDNSNGINLHVNLDEEIPHVDILDLADLENDITHFNDFNIYKLKYFGTAEQRADSNAKNIIDAKNKIYHYGMFIHTWNNTGYSGIAKDIPSMDFVVSLGYSKFPNAWPKDPQTNHSTGTSTQQKGTLLHELGHTIGLGHGGNDGINYKPNYLSRMNYHFQLDSVSNAPLEYSRCELNFLDENSLNESIGIRESCPPGYQTKFYIECSNDENIPHTRQIVTTGVPINWNGNNNTHDNNVKKNLNCDKYRDGSQALANLKGNDDWNKLKYIGQDSVISLETKDESFNLPNTNGQNSTADLLNNSSSVIDEMTFNDLRSDVLGTIISIGQYIKDIPKSSWQIPSTNTGQNVSDFESLTSEFDAEILGKKYYEKVLGVPIITEQSSNLLAETPNLDNVISDINQGDIDSAINKLEGNIINTSDSSFGGLLSDDRIKTSENQLELAQLVTNVINTLKAQSCTFDRCE